MGNHQPSSDLQLLDLSVVWKMTHTETDNSGDPEERERIVMSDKQEVVEEAAEEHTQEEGARTTSQEVHLQVQDLFQALKDLMREGTVRRVMILRNDRVLVDIPLAAGVAASLALAMYMPHITALAAAGALIGGCTLRIEREEPPEES
jgi:hypothetical protein